MRANVVVPVAEDGEVDVELSNVGHLPLIELLLEGAEQTFDPAVLPGAAGRGALVADAKMPQPLAEDFGGEYCFVVGTDGLRLAVGADGVFQAGEQCAGSFAGQCLQMQQGTTAVIDNAEQVMQSTLGVGFAGEVYTPDAVARDNFGWTVFEVTAQDLDFVAVPLQ